MASEFQAIDTSDIKLLLQYPRSDYSHAWGYIIQACRRNGYRFFDGSNLIFFHECASDDSAIVLVTAFVKDLGYLSSQFLSAVRAWRKARGMPELKRAVYKNVDFKDCKELLRNGWREYDINHGETWDSDTLYDDQSHAQVILDYKALSDCKGGHFKNLRRRIQHNKASFSLVPYDHEKHCDEVRKMFLRIDGGKIGPYSEAHECYLCPVVALKDHQEGGGYDSTLFSQNKSVLLSADNVVGLFVTERLNEDMNCLLASACDETVKDSACWGIIAAGKQLHEQSPHLPTVFLNMGGSEQLRLLNFKKLFSPPIPLLVAKTHLLYTLADNEEEKEEDQGEKEEAGRSITVPLRRQSRRTRNFLTRFHCSGIHGQFEYRNLRYDIVGIDHYHRMPNEKIFGVALGSSAEERAVWSSYGSYERLLSDRRVGIYILQCLEKLKAKSACKVILPEVGRSQNPFEKIRNDFTTFIKDEPMIDESFDVAKEIPEELRWESYSVTQAPPLGYSPDPAKLAALNLHHFSVTCNFGFSDDETRMLSWDCTPVPKEKVDSARKDSGFIVEHPACSGLSLVLFEGEQGCSTSICTLSYIINKETGEVFCKELFYGLLVDEEGKFVSLVPVDRLKSSASGARYVRNVGPFEITEGYWQPYYEDVTAFDMCSTPSPAPKRSDKAHTMKTITQLLGRRGRLIVEFVFGQATTSSVDGYMV